MSESSIGDVCIIADLSASGYDYLANLIKRAGSGLAMTPKELRVLLRAQDSTEVDLVRSTGFPLPRLRALLFRVQGKGLIKSHEADEAISLTQAGQEFIEKIVSEMNDDIKRALTPYQSKELINLSIRLASLLGALVPRD